MIANPALDTTARSKNAACTCICVSLSHFRYLIFLTFFGITYFPVFSQNFNIILGRPTSSAVTASIMFDEATEVYWQLGTMPGIYTDSTGVRSAGKNVPLEYDLAGLLPDTRYYYVTRYRPAGSSGSFLSSSEYTFHTQRAEGSTFTFTVEADEHLYNYGDPGLYRITLHNEGLDNPDFMISLGDIFGDDRNPWTITSSDCDSLHRRYRYFLGDICHSVPFYICLGNHEGEKQYFLDTLAPNNLAFWSTLWRKYYYPNPYPDGFYSGDTVQEGYGIGQPENYYAWTWGDALFVVLDAYRTDCRDSVRSEKPGGWDWTLGETQYLWLKETLENSQARFKFVFAHHVRGENRGGVIPAGLFEWGGYNTNGSWGFDTHRTGWTRTIHELYTENKVNIFFQGHDHLFAHEVMDSVTYQEVPMAADATYNKGMLANSDAYTSDTLNASGHIRVTVSPSCVRVQYVRAFLPKDTLSGQNHNREVSFSYSIGNCPLGIADAPASQDIRVYPNPASEKLTVVLPEGTTNYTISMINNLGQTVLQSGSELLDVKALPPGFYGLQLTAPGIRMMKKVLIFR